MIKFWKEISFLFVATAALLNAPVALAQNNSPWGPPSQQNSTPWGSGGGSSGSGGVGQGSSSLSFPAQGVICDSSVSVCFNAGGAALFDTEREFGRRARVSLESKLINSPIIDVTFADGRYCNFRQRGCWTNRQRTTFDQQLNPWVFGANAVGGIHGGPGTVIGGAGSSWGSGSGTNSTPPPTNTYQPAFTRTSQSGTCTWMSAAITTYNGSCRYEILQNNLNGSKNLTFTFDNLPKSSNSRRLQFIASGNNPWTIQMANGLSAPVQSSLTPSQTTTRISMDWNNVSSLRFESSTQATTALLNQSMQVVDANGQVQPSDAEALGQALGGLLRQLFGGN